MLALAGWFVVHSLWVGPLLAAAFLLWFHVGGSSAKQRYVAGLVALGASLLLPIAIAVTTADPLAPAARMALTSAVDSSVGFAQFLGGRRIVVPAVAILWFAGVLMGLVRVCRQWMSLRRLRATSNHVGLREREALTDVLATWMPAGRITLATSDAVQVPMVFGALRPALILPASHQATLSTTQLRAIVLHELAHVRRQDYAWNLGQTLGDIVLWCNPAARWMSRQVRLYREVCCDEEVVSAGINAREYASALATLDASRDDHSLAIAASSGTLVERIARLAGRQVRPTATRVTTVVVVCVMAAGLVFAAAFTIPPDIELDAQLRQRSPGPAGVMPPAGPSFPRRPAGQ